MKRNNIDLCRSLRKNQTEAEKKLWSVLRNRQLAGVKFRRQFSIGRYILDFYAPEYKLGIEADGGQHYEEAGICHNRLREEELSRLGVKMLRFDNLDILNNIEGVHEVVRKTIEEKRCNSPHLNPLPTGERRSD